MKNKKIIKFIIFFLCTTLLVLSLIPIISGCKGKEGDKDVRSSRDNKKEYKTEGSLKEASGDSGFEKLSTDQKKLVSLIGYPDVFTVIFDEENNNIRLEIWIYEALSSSYNFIDGVFRGREKNITAELEPDKYNIKPDDFSYEMTPDQVNNLIGESGVEAVLPETELKLLIFGNGLIYCTFNPDNLLVGVARIRREILQSQQSQQSDESTESDTTESGFDFFK